MSVFHIAGGIFLIAMAFIPEETGKCQLHFECLVWCKKSVVLKCKRFGVVHEQCCFNQNLFNPTLSCLNVWTDTRSAQVPFHLFCLFHKITIPFLFHKINISLIITASGVDLIPLIITCAMGAKFCIALTYGVIVMYSRELFPTNLR